MIKKSLLAIFLAICCLIADAQIRTPSASPAGSVSSTVGLTDITITYSRPRLRGRKVFGTGDVMHEYGKIWRTGANNGTVIEFSTDVKVEGTDLKAGKYLVLTIPGATEWTVILYNDVSLGGDVDAHKDENDAARFTVKAEKLSKKVETLTFGIPNIADDNKTATIEMAWEDVSLKFNVSVNYDEMVMKSIEANTKVNPGNYVAAANYYLENGKDLKKALEWIDMGISQGNPNAFWNIHTKAKIQKAMGDKKGAKETAQKSLELAKNSGNDFGYIKINEDFIKSLK